jgi:hypothetical protein
MVWEMEFIFTSISSDAAATVLAFWEESCAFDASYVVMPKSFPEELSTNFESDAISEISF